MHSFVSRFIISLIAITLSQFSFAENSTKIPGYTIHHNAITTDSISPAVAHSYRIPRSRYRAMINISIIKDKAGTTGTAMKSRVSAQAKNVQSLIRNIPLFEIKEGDAIYYIGHFPITDKEELSFNIQVQPAGENQTHEVSFKNRFFIN